MRIQLDSQEAAAALVDYLRRCDCTVRPMGTGVVEALPPRPAREAHQASIELEGYLRVWRILHPEYKVRLFALTS